MCDEGGVGSLWSGTGPLDQFEQTPQALHHQLHLGNDHDEPRPPRPMLLQEKSDVASAAAALPLDVERKRLAAQEVAALRWRPAPPKIEVHGSNARNEWRAPSVKIGLPCRLLGSLK